MEISSRWETLPNAKGWRLRFTTDYLPPYPTEAPTKELSTFGPRERGPQQLVTRLLNALSAVLHGGARGLPTPAFLLQSPSTASTGPSAPHLPLLPRPGWHTRSHSQNGHLACGETGRACQPCLPQVFTWLLPCARRWATGKNMPVKALPLRSFHSLGGGR